MSTTNRNQKLIEDLRAVIAEALEPGVFGYQDRTGISGSEDAEVAALCDRVGYGAVMDSASRMWRKKLTTSPHGDLSGGEHTTAACASVRQDWCNRAAAALAASSPPADAKAGAEGGGMCCPLCGHAREMHGEEDECDMPNCDCPKTKRRI